MSRNKQGSLTEGPVLSTMLTFTVPFLLSNVLQTLYGTVDTLTVGNFGSTAGLSAVSTGAQILSLVTFLTIGVSSGSTVLVGQCIGAQDEKRAARVVGNTIIDFTLISLIMMLIMFFAYPFFLDVLNVPPEAVSEAHRYMRICCLGIPLIIGYNIVCALLRAMGDSKSPLIFVGVACVVNVIGDLVLTGAFHMGAAGVAIATVAAQGVSFFFSLFFLIKRGMSFAFSSADIRFDQATSAQIFRIGIPMGVQSVLLNLSFMFITAIINAMGLTASAAMGIGDKIVGFAFMPQGAFSASVSVIVAQNIGARKPDRAMLATRMAIAICVGIECVFCAVCLIWPHLLPSVFTSELEVIEMAGLYMKAYSLDGICTGITFCLSGLLNGCGKTSFNLVQNLISTFLGRVPATWLLSRIPSTNLFLIGLAAPISTVMSIFLLGGYIMKGYWKKGLLETENRGTSDE